MWNISKCFYIMRWQSEMQKIEVDIFFYKKIKTKTCIFPVNVKCISVSIAVDIPHILSYYNI